MKDAPRYPKTVKEIHNLLQRTRELHLHAQPATKLKNGEVYSRWVLVLPHLVTKLCGGKRCYRAEIT
jgi:hypothetical protein